jgi:hypothetical protein
LALFNFYQSTEQLFLFFQQVIANDRVRTVIPVTEILPYSIEFKEDIWKIPFALLNIKHKIGEVSYESWLQGQTTIPVPLKYHIFVQ